MVAGVALGAMLAVGTYAMAQQAQPASPRIYNTVKQKLIDGKQVVGGAAFVPDADIYCAVANAGFDFIWIEMQHGTLITRLCRPPIGTLPA